MRYKEVITNKNQLRFTASARSPPHALQGGNYK